MKRTITVADVAKLFGSDASKASTVLAEYVVYMPMDRAHANLLRLEEMFKRLAAAPVKRETPLITLLEFEIHGSGDHSARSVPFRHTPTDLEMMDNKRSEPIYVYNPKKSRKHT